MRKERKLGKNEGFRENLHLIALQGKLELEFAKIQKKGKIQVIWNLSTACFERNFEKKKIQI